MNEVNLEEDREKRLMAMGRMAASLAHEIRNPLGSMELFCTLLKKDIQDQPSALNLCEQIHAGIRRLERVIANSLQFAKDITPRRQSISDVPELINEAMVYIIPRAESTGVKLSAQNLGSGEIEVDPYQVNQVLLNLLINALDAAIGGSGVAGFEPEVAIISDLTSPDIWKVSIVDNGVGISEEDQRVMFDPFFSTKEKGTGLGLAIVHSIVRAHDGHIVVNSVVGKGTTVDVVIPRQAK